jgi:hypothetical protein
MTTDYEYALLTDAFIKNNDSNPFTSGAVPAGWALADNVMFSGDFAASAYYKVDAQGDISEIVFAYDYPSFFSDLYESGSELGLPSLYNSLSPQLGAFSDAFYSAFISENIDPEIIPTFIGHGGGAFLAEIAAMHAGARAVTFNNPGTGGLDITPAEGFDSTIYQTSGKIPLTHTYSQVGEVIQLDVVESLTAFTQAGLEAQADILGNPSAAIKSLSLITIKAVTAGYATCISSEPMRQIAA